MSMDFTLSPHIFEPKCQNFGCDKFSWRHLCGLVKIGKDLSPGNPCHGINAQDAARRVHRTDEEELDRRGRQGQSRTGHATQPKDLWRRAARLWDQALAAETAWERVQSEFESFTPEGRFNDQRHAEAVIAAALPHLSGLAWAQARRWRLRRESVTFLDPAERRLAGLGLEPAV